MLNKTNKSSLAPRADLLSSLQLRFLLLNSPFTVVLNNYKAKLSDLNVLRSLIFSNNGFAYHPNKNIKTRSFKEFNMVLSSDLLNGLVVFAFFREYSDLKSFFNSIELKNDFNSIGYFSIFLYGHLTEKAIINNSLFIQKNLNFFRTNLICNKIIFTNTFNIFNFSISKIYFILNAYIKSIN